MGLHGVLGTAEGRRMESEPAATLLQPRCPLLAAPWVNPAAQRDGARAVVVARGGGTSCTPPQALFCARRSNVAGQNQWVLLLLVPWVSPNVPCEGLERCHPFLHSPSCRIHTAAA